MDLKGAVVVITGAVRGLGRELARSLFAVNGFTQSLQGETEAGDIRVIAVYPGGMKTDLFADARPEHYDGYMNPADVAQKITDNLWQDKPEASLVIQRIE